ncbi:MAG: MnhB domain-containing protein [Puniceicoccaceae bacterium]
MKNPGSYLFRSAATILFFLLNVMSLYLLLRGHNLPGGGFIAGLVSAVSIILIGLARGFEEIEKLLGIDPLRMASIGLLIAVLTAMLPLLGFFPGNALFEQTMFHVNTGALMGELHFGTTLLFDIGVFLVVVGIAVKVVMVFARSTSGAFALPADRIPYYASSIEKPVEERADSATERTEDGR